MNKCMRMFPLVILAAATLSFAQETVQKPNSSEHQPQRGMERRDFRGVFGEITELSASSLKIKQPNGTLASVSLTPDTKFRQQRQEAKLSDLKVGDNVTVRGEATGENAWKATVVSVVPSRTEMESQFRNNLGKTMVIGEVKSIDPPKLTVQRVDGVEQTIEADENTSFRRGRGEDITMPDIKAGDTIFARGAIKDGVFVPTTVSVIDPEMARMMKERGAMFGMAGAAPNSGSPASKPENPKL
ncbi:MAG TPA: DUF5666 domain-containing protein [Terriglobales bacterium]|nr:DUF5666 domain-containing protein [Terriglobales bacterium]